MGELLMMPMKTVEWTRNDERMLITYHARSKRVIECSHVTPFFDQRMPYSVVHVILTRNDWTEGDTFDVVE